MDVPLTPHSQDDEAQGRIAGDPKANLNWAGTQ
jgi:hypothetical protein